jgi:enoyl-[acyl-carrier-protein] reductase (NADH)
LERARRNDGDGCRKGETLRRKSEHPKRIVEPDELGAMAAMLSSDAAGAVTGQVISVDGGFMV